MTNKTEIEVVPAIIPFALADIEDEVRQVRQHVKWVQVDIVDGHFAPVTTWPNNSKESRRELARIESQEIGLPFWEDVQYEFHLMVEDPLNVLDIYIQIGGSGLVLHAETLDQDALQKAWEIMHESKIKKGLAFKPSTYQDGDPLGLFTEDSQPDFIQIMGSDKLGHHGVELDKVVYKIVREVREKYPKLGIAVDIGVNQETAPELLKAGVTKLVSGSAIFDSLNVGEAISELKQK